MKLGRIGESDPFPSPRLRGEVGAGAKRRLRVRGTLSKRSLSRAPLTRNSRFAQISTSPRKRGEVIGDFGARSGIWRHGQSTVILLANIIPKLPPSPPRKFCSPSFCAL